MRRSVGLVNFYRNWGRTKPLPSPVSKARLVLNSAPGKSWVLEPLPGVRIPKEVAPKPPVYSSEEEIDRLRETAYGIVAKFEAEIDHWLRAGRYQLRLSKPSDGPNLKHHVIVAGATGEGLGLALACALVKLLPKGSSLLLLSREPKGPSLGRFTGEAFMARNRDKGIAIDWLSDGMNTKGKDWQLILNALGDAKDKNIVYINTVFRMEWGLMPYLPPTFMPELAVGEGAPNWGALAVEEQNKVLQRHREWERLSVAEQRKFEDEFKGSGGEMPYYPPTFIPDLDKDNKLIQWPLPRLTEHQIKRNEHFMGELPINFPQKLRASGFTIGQEHYVDHGATSEFLARIPGGEIYGRFGPWPTCMYRPKKIVEEYVRTQFYEKRRSVRIHQVTSYFSTSMRLMHGAKLISRAQDKVSFDQFKFLRTLPKMSLKMLDRFRPDPYKGQEHVEIHDQGEIDIDNEVDEVLRNIINPHSKYYHGNWVHGF